MIQFIPCKSSKGLEKTDDIIYLDDKCGNSMAKKYNYAIKNYILDSKDDWFCFRHLDLHILTNFDIIKYQLSEFAKNNVFIAGLIGTYALEPSCIWWNPFRECNGAGHIKQSVLDANGKPIQPQQTYDMNDWPGIHEGLASVDGCCMFINRKIFEMGIRFDENLKGFHFYDSDFCLQCLQNKLKIGIVNVDAIHDSAGKMPPEFGEYQKNMFDKWNSKVSVWPITRYTKFVNV
jgi:hypothetical protein